MPLDSRIILGAGVGVQPIDTPLEIEAKRAALAQVRQKAQDDQQARAADAAFRQALQATGGDYDAAIQQSEQQGFNMLPVREAIQKQRKGDIEMAKSLLDQHKIENEMTSGLMAKVNDQASWDAVRPLIGRYDPEFAQHAGPTYGPQFEQFKAIGTTATQQQEWTDKALTHYANGDYQKGFGAALMATHDQEDLDGALQFADRQGVPKYITNAYRRRQWTPEIQQEGNALALGAQKATAEKDTSAKVGTFEDYVTRTYGPNPTPAQILAARKAYGQADDRPRVSVSVGGANGPGLTTGPGGGLESLATQYRLTKRFPVGVARTISKQDANAAINLAAEQDKLLGRSAAASIQKAAMFQANAAAEKQMAVLGAGTEAAESKALGQIDIIKELSPKVWRTQSTTINNWLVNPTQQFTGNKDAQSLANAILTFSSEYAKIINGSVGSVAGASDSARNDAAELISNALSHGNLVQQLDLMRREMALTRVGYDVAQQHIADQMQGPQVPGTGQTPAPDPAALRQKYKY